MACAHRPGRTQMLSEMRKATNEFFARLKVQIIDAATSLPVTEQEEFYSELHEWAYGKYEETLLCQEAEMQDYDEDEAY